MHTHTHTRTRSESTWADLLPVEVDLRPLLALWAGLVCLFALVGAVSPAAGVADVLAAPVAVGIALWRTRSLIRFAREAIFFAIVAVFWLRRGWRFGWRLGNG